MTEMTFAGRTAEQWDDEAAECVRSEADSWERSDTDGFLTQWASIRMAGHYRFCAQIARDGGVIECPALFTTSGVLIEGARHVETRYGWAWVYDTDDGLTVWVNESKARTPEKRQAAMQRKGYDLGTVTFRAELNSRTGAPYATREVVAVVSRSETGWFGF